MGIGCSIGVANFLRDRNPQHPCKQRHSAPQGGMCNQRLHARHPKLPLAAGGHPSKHSRCVHNRKKVFIGNGLNCHSPRNRTGRYAADTSEKCCGAIGMRNFVPVAEAYRAKSTVNSAQVISTLTSRPEDVSSSRANSPASRTAWAKFSPSATGVNPSLMRHSPKWLSLMVKTTDITTSSPEAPQCAMPLYALASLRISSETVEACPRKLPASVGFRRNFSSGRECVRQLATSPCNDKKHMAIRSDGHVLVWRLVPAPGFELGTY